MGEYVKDFRQGDTKVIKINYGAGVDITGWKFWFTLRKEIGDSTYVAQATTTAGDNPDDDPPNGLAYITLSSADSMTIPAAKYYYDVQVSKGGSPPVIKTILPPIESYKDRIEVVPGITVATT
jgi:hypothetical protein